MNLHESVFWQETVSWPVAEEAAPLPTKVEVAIIGGGYTGLAAARTLAQHGVRVAVLEAHTFGWGASSRNGGMVLSGLKLSAPAVLQKYGRGLARRLFQCSLEAISTVEQIIDEEHIACGFARQGHLLVASKPGDQRALQEEAEVLEKEFNHPVRLLAANELKDEIDSEIYFGGLLDESSGGLNPAQYVVGLSHAARKAGASLHARARVTRLGRSLNRFVIETERGPVQAERVLVATAGYTDSLIPYLNRRILPIGSFIIATENLGEQVQALIPRQRMVFDSRHYLNYFRLWDGRLIFGGRAAFFPETSGTIRRSAEILRQEMLRVFPQLKGAQVEFAWGGTLDFARDLMPHVGEHAGVVYALGYAGHGVALGTFLGKTVAEAMLKDNLREHPFAAYSFPLAPKFPLALPLAGLWYRLLDWIE
ncbi:MAG: NAD(P)/FAD-dependent oxidoreductase [Anaerolineae bacterium]